MRVTNSMIASQTLFFTRRSIGDFLRLQGQLSTGRRINTPSDDPIGIQRALGYRTDISDTEQYQTNISLSTNLLDAYDSDLAEMKNIIQGAIEIGLAVNDDSNDSPEIDPAYVSELSAAIDRMIQLANHTIEGRSIFSGHKTDIAPVISATNGFVYAGDFGSMAIEIDRSSSVNVNVNAADTILKRLLILGESANLNSGIDGATALSSFNSGSGVTIGQFSVTDNNLGIATTIDLGSPTTTVNISEVITRINASLTGAGIANLTAGIGSSGNIVFTATPNGMVGANTSLGNLNGGAGVDLQPGQLRIHTADDAINVTISLAGAQTVSDVLTAINTQLANAGVSNVSASINLAGTGLRITDTNALPLGLIVDEVETTEATASGLGLRGNIGAELIGAELKPQVDFTVAENGGATGADLGILGSYHANFAGSNVNATISNSTPIGLLKGGLGLPLGELKLSQGREIRQINLGAPGITTVGDILAAINTSGLNVTATINPSQKGIQVRSNSTVDSFTIEEVGQGAVARGLQINGASDLMGALLSLKSQVQEGIDGGVTSDRIEPLMRTLERGLAELLSVRGDVGARTVRLNATAARHIAAKLSSTAKLSDIEDADITELVTQLASKENNYRASLVASAKIIQPSLLDFLR